MIELDLVVFGAKIQENDWTWLFLVSKYRRVIELDLVGFGCERMGE